MSYFLVLIDERELLISDSYSKNDCIFFTRETKCLNYLLLGSEEQFVF